MSLIIVKNELSLIKELFSKYNNIAVPFDEFEDAKIFKFDSKYIKNFDVIDTNIDYNTITIIPSTKTTKYIADLNCVISKDIETALKYISTVLTKRIDYEFNFGIEVEFEFFTKRDLKFVPASRIVEDETRTNPIGLDGNNVGELRSYMHPNIEFCINDIKSLSRRLKSIADSNNLLVSYYSLKFPLGLHVHVSAYNMNHLLVKSKIYLFDKANFRYLVNINPFTRIHNHYFREFIRVKDNKHAEWRRLPAYIIFKNDVILRSFENYMKHPLSSGG